MTTLTYVYADQTAVLGPLATFAEPHAYDLCDQHSERLSAPRGWEVLRLARDRPQAGPSPDDLLALADAVRETGYGAGQGRYSAGPGRVRDHGPAVGTTGQDADRDGGRRGHLRVLRSDD
ncbi:MAG: DUF3499 domain-containing protein [Nocardioides sp.]